MRKIMILASLFIATACNKGEIVPTLDNTKINLAVSTGNVDTRIVIDEDNSTDKWWKFVWENNESISAWYSGCSELQTLTMQTYDKELSTFTGTLPSSVTQIRLIHPMDEVGQVSDKNYTIDISAQDGELNKLYMMSDNLVAVGSGGQVETTPEMKHLGGFILLSIELKNAIANSTYEITEVKLGGVPTTLAVDMSGDFLDTNTTFYDDSNSDGTITATLSGKTITSDQNKVDVRLNTLPFIYKVGDKLTFDIKFKIGQNEYTSQFVKINNQESNIPFERAKFNYTTITLDEVHITGCTINGWGDGTEGDNDLDAKPVVSDL